MRAVAQLVQNLRGMLAVLLISLLSLAPTVTAHASVNDFIITKFDAGYVLTNHDPQGEMRVTERINVHFNDYNHGLLRAIPKYYKKHLLQIHINSITSETAAPTTFTSSFSEGNTVLRIGDPKTVVTGDQEYTIDYTVHNVIGFYPDHDELYWDINGTGWQQPFQEVSVALQLPDELMLDSHRPLCFTGGNGSTASDCSIVTKGTTTIQANSLHTLNAGETMSIVVGMQKGYFQPSTWRDTVGEYLGMTMQFLVPFLLIGGGGWLYWFKRGRDAKGKGVIVPEYEAPDKLLPIEVGTLVDFKTENRDLTATIIDLAIRGYIKIIEERKPRKLLGETLEYTLKLTKTDTSALKPAEDKLLRALFTPFELDQEVSLSYLRYKLAQKALEVRKDVDKELTDNGYFKTSPLAIANYHIVIFLSLIIVSFAVTFINKLFHVTLALWGGIVAGYILLYIFMFLAPSRTLKGVEAREKILGLKLYLKTAEADRIKMLQSPNAPYADHTAPKQTVELFEKLLPYAMVLGVEQEWAKQFEAIYRTPPDWYSGNWTTFSSVYLVSSMNAHMVSSVNSAFGSSSNSSGSGFGGGGSAGGGGGGGGGGGW